MKAALCAGGTGGHLLPALVLFESMRTGKWDTRLLCRRKDSDLSERLAALGSDLVFLPGRGLPRKLSRELILFMADLVRSFFVSLRFMTSFRPDVVVTFGGYIGFAPVLAAAICRIPVVMIEQNSVPGLANRLSAPFCGTILLHFEAAKAHLKRGLVTGHPVDSGIALASRKKSLDLFGLTPGRKTLLVTGGSQGARGLNRIVLETIGSKEFEGWNVLWSCGRNNVREISAAFGPKDEGRVAVAGFFEDMAAAYAAADVAVCRAGAATLSELAACGLPAVLVPYPAATDDHQYFNAQAYAAANRAIIIREQELSSDRLIRAVRELAAKPRTPPSPEHSPEKVNGRILAAIRTAASGGKGD